MKGAKRRRRSPVVVTAILTACGILMLILSNTLLKNWIVIGYGVRALGKIRIIWCCLIALNAVLSIVLITIPLIREARGRRERLEREKRSAQDRSKILNNYAQDSTNPDFTRKRLEQLRIETPELEDLITQCLDQMDMMDLLQEKQDALIEANDARYLKDTIAVLNNVERRICRNFRNVINLCIAAESVESLDEEKIHSYLEDNRKKLSDTKRLLKASADWINQYNADEESDRSEVESWIAVIHNSLREE